MGKRKFGPGDWARIKYGEFAGQYGKVAAFLKEGRYVVIPYGKDNETGPMLALDARSLDIVPPYTVNLEELKSFARAEKMYSDIKDAVFPAFNVKATTDYELSAADIKDAINNINRRCGVSDEAVKRSMGDILEERLDLQLGDFSPQAAYRDRKERPVLDMPERTEAPKDCLGQFREWFWLLMNIFYENLHIDERYDEDFFSDAPENDDEIFCVAYGLAEKLYWRLEERYSQKEDIDKHMIGFETPLDWNKGGRQKQIEEIGYNIVCSDIIGRVEAYLANVGRPKELWVYALSAKKHIVMSYDSGENNLKDATPEALEKYREMVWDLYTEGDVQALRILAWGHYEGNEVYPQDWKLSEKYLLELFKRTGDPYAANSLGYIYYYGRTEFTFRPDYEKAFYYFSYGALAGIDESTYKAGDMLIAGKGTVRNLDMGLNMIVDGYRDSMNDFCDGHFDNKLADYAFRMGNACRDGLIYGMNLRDAYKFYLEAQYAIRERRKTGGHYGDDAVEARINHELDVIAERMNLDLKKNVVKTDFPLYISQLFDDRFPLKIVLKAPAENSKSRNGSMTVSRFRPGAEIMGMDFLADDEELQKMMEIPKILVAYPELSYAEMVSEITYGLENITVAQKNDKGPFILADGFRKNEQTNALEFFANGQMVAAVEAEWYTIRVNKNAGKKTEKKESK